MGILSNSYFTICLLLGIVALMFYIHDLRRKNTLLQQVVRRLHLQERAQLSQLEEQKDADKLNREEALFVKVCQYMDEAKPFTNPSLKIEDVVEALGTNRTYLGNAIRRYANGLTIQQFITRYRLRYAASLLEKATDDTPLSQLAEQAGFASRSTFNKHFFQFFHYTPSDFKALLSRQRMGDTPSNREKTLEK